MNEEDLFENVPSEITIDILSRLPVRTIATSKCVCKQWLGLIETPEFVKSHLSRSAPGLVVYQYATRKFEHKTFTIFDVEEEAMVDFEEMEPYYNISNKQLEFPRQHLRCIRVEGSANHFNPITQFDFPIQVKHEYQRDVRSILCSCNGLLFRRVKIDDIHSTHDLYICNPITRDLLKLPSPQLSFTPNEAIIDTYGFGITKITSQYKVVRIVMEPEPCSCEVYTLGTGTWRNVAVPCRDLIEGIPYVAGTLYDGKLHWLVPGSNGCSTITSFDLETETLAAFSPSPPTIPKGEHFLGWAPLVLSGCLCLCVTTSDNDDEILVWMMKNEHWQKQVNISSIHPGIGFRIFIDFHPLMIFKNGDVLMILVNTYSSDLFYYSGRHTQSTKLYLVPKDKGRTEVMVHTPSFVSLKSFVMENVSSF